MADPKKIGLFCDVIVNANLGEPIKLVMETLGKRTIAELKDELKELLRKKHPKWGPILVRSLKAPHKGGLYYLPGAYQLKSLVNLGLVGDSLVARCSVSMGAKQKRKVSLEPAAALDGQPALGAKAALQPRKKVKKVVKGHASDAAGSPGSSAAAPSPPLQLPQLQPDGIGSIPAADPMVPFERTKKTRKRNIRRKRCREGEAARATGAGNDGDRLADATSPGAGTPDLPPQALPPTLQAAAGAGDGVRTAAVRSKEEKKEKKKKNKQLEETRAEDTSAADGVKGNRAAAEQPERQRQRQQEAQQAERDMNAPAEQHVSKKQRRGEHRAAAGAPPNSLAQQQQHADKAAEQRLAKKQRRGDKCGAAAAVEAQAQQQARPEQRRGKEVEAEQQEDLLLGTQAASHVPKRPQVTPPLGPQGVKPAEPAEVAVMDSRKGDGAKAGSGGEGPGAKHLANGAGQPVTAAASGSSSGSGSGSSEDSGSDAGADSGASPPRTDFTRHPSTAGKLPKSGLLEVAPTQEEESDRSAEVQAAEEALAAAEDGAGAPGAGKMADAGHAPPPPTQPGGSNSSGADSERGSGSESESGSESGSGSGSGSESDADGEERGQVGKTTGPKALSRDEAALTPRSPSGSSSETDSEEEGEGEEQPPAQVLTQPSGKFTGAMGFNSIISRFGTEGGKSQTTGGGAAAAPAAAGASQGAAAATAVSPQWAKPHTAYDCQALRKLCRGMVREALNIERTARGLPQLPWSAPIYQKDTRPDWWPLDSWSAKTVESSKGAAIQVYNAARKVLAAEHDVALESETEGGGGGDGKKKAAQR